MPRRGGPRDCGGRGGVSLRAVPCPARDVRYQNAFRLGGQQLNFFLAMRHAATSANPFFPGSGEATANPVLLFARTGSVPFTFLGPCAVSGPTPRDLASWGALASGGGEEGSSVQYMLSLLEFPRLVGSSAGDAGKAGEVLTGEASSGMLAPFLQAASAPGPTSVLATRRSWRRGGARSE